ncbi:O-antigen ligase family protein [Bacillus sp. AK128]
MITSLRKYQHSFESFLLIYIMIQPLIDILTTLSIFALKVNLTLGIIIRLLVLLLAGAYLFIVNDEKQKKRAIIYLVILAAFFIINLVISLAMKNPVSIFGEVRNLAKLAYFPVILFAYIFAFRSLKKRIDWDQTVQKFVYISMTIVASVMLIAGLTGTGIKSYESIKKGHQGWFFAGNEIGAIMAISFTVVVLYAVRKTTSWKTTYYWIPVLLMMYALLSLGTKVGYGAIAIVLGVALVMKAIEWLKTRKKAILISIIVNLLLLVGFWLITPHTPTYYNTTVHLRWVVPKESKEKVDNNEITKDDIPSEGIENMLLSGRENFLEQHKLYFDEAPVVQKLFGMGYGGNYEETPKTVEMDFYDLFFNLGILGAILFLLPLLYFAMRIIWKLITNLKEYFNLEIVLFGSGLVLALGIAYTAGHVFFAPAVSVYVAILLAYLVVKMEVFEK